VAAFTQQEPLQTHLTPVSLKFVLKSGRLHRYGMAAGEASDAVLGSLCQLRGARFCLAVTSGGQALQIALRAVGVISGDAVLTNAFTPPQFPERIAAVGGQPVGRNRHAQDLTIDEDLDRKAVSSWRR
jgi:dTDP-4-amino-4,6-dideoxygalactose transaminase